MENSTIGQRIKALRKERKITQARLSKLVGVSNVAISQWERGETEPNGENLLALSSALGCTPHFIAKGEVTHITVPESEPFNAGSGNHDEAELTPRKRILLELFDELPESEADELLEALKEKKRHYDTLYEELKKKRHGKAS